MKKNCLTCKFEPVWSDPVGVGEKRYQAGFCAYELPLLPATFSTSIDSIILNYVEKNTVACDGKYIDNCQVWEKK